MCAAAVATAVSVAGGILAAPVAGAQGSVAEPAPAFYQPPADLPASAGALVRTEAFPLAGAIPPIPGADVLTNGAGPFSTDAQRIMYTSVGSRNQPIAVTGTYLQPRAPWTGPGTRPLAVLAPGTQGMGDFCAPSKTFQSLVSLRTEPLGLGFGYEILFTYALLARGFAVAVPDYEGLGTPGTHAYLNRESAARSVLDIARAADQVPGSDIGSAPRTVFAGYSQGGAAVAAATELHPSYAPEINLLGTSAGSPPADLLATIDTLDGTLLTGVVGYALNGLVQADPELGPVIDGYLNDSGRAMLAATSDQCAVETGLQYFTPSTESYTVSGRSARDVLREDPVLMQAVERQRIGRLKPSTPVQILSPLNDDAVPSPQSQQLGRDWCAQDVAVDMVIDPLPPVATGLTLNHAVPLITNLGGTTQYLVDRVDGRPAPFNCGTY